MVWLRASDQCNGESPEDSDEVAITERGVCRSVVEIIGSAIALSTAVHERQLHDRCGCSGRCMLANIPKGHLYSVPHEESKKIVTTHFGSYLSN